MIHLTRLNGRPLVVNADLIKFIERAPDTVITLLTGEKLIVREAVEGVLERVHAFHIHSGRRIASGIAELPSRGGDTGLTQSEEPTEPAAALPPASKLAEDEQT